MTEKKMKRTRLDVLVERFKKKAQEYADLEEALSEDSTYKAFLIARQDLEQMKAEMTDEARKAALKDNASHVFVQEGNMQFSVVYKSPKMILDFDMASDLLDGDVLATLKPDMIDPAKWMASRSDIPKKVLKDIESLVPQTPAVTVKW